MAQHRASTSFWPPRCPWGCANGSSAPTSDSTRPVTSSTAVPGRVYVVVTGEVDLTITDAVAHLDRSGDGSLHMTVRNDDGVHEHLGMVATPRGKRGELVGGKSAEGDGSLSTAGILVTSGTSVTFGSADGPRVLLHHVHGVSTRQILPVALQFGVAGLVRFQARVSSP
ncbi:hypothetical protein GQF42_34035 [Streptomyces broussonetiae]|uniref:Uncharacterized protein n=1 Tax=Streptomyces broussonetiae TaxID=2686304 RepID=A0A6I6NPJ7_9ACTN|nr:hypothetical protein GQF42_34035 [Streptomyces broussonetiae]